MKRTYKYFQIFLWGLRAEKVRGKAVEEELREKSCGRNVVRKKIWGREGGREGGNMGKARRSAYGQILGDDCATDYRTFIDPHIRF